jgi:hypothetical protein
MSMAQTFIIAGVMLLVAGQDASPPASTAAGDAELRKELLARMKEDQEFRTKLTPLFARQRAGKGAQVQHEIDALMKQGTETDKRNTAWLKKVVEKHGWPGNSLVGTDGALAAFLLVQHADLDHAFQSKCLPLLAEAVKKKDLSPSYLAYLTDRVALAENRKQVYGTQLRTENGKLVPAPIEDEANVDRRRKEVGLQPLAEYVKMVESGERPKDSGKSEGAKKQRPDSRGG